jgi:hypothetical protein
MAFLGFGPPKVLEICLRLAALMCFAQAAAIATPFLGIPAVGGAPSAVAFVWILGYPIEAGVLCVVGFLLWKFRRSGAVTAFFVLGLEIGMRLVLREPLKDVWFVADVAVLLLIVAGWTRLNAPSLDGSKPKS